MTPDPPPGFLLIDKEQGWTSHDVVAKLRGPVAGKVGHAGTLDPMATGLLVLAVGRATRLLRFVQGAEKEYLATAQLGVATDTLDADGAILERSPMAVDRDDIEGVLDRFRGEILQVPPMVSARKVEGKRLYELAREGKVVEREARPVTIHRLELVDVAPSDYPEVTFRAVCSTGTYVRTLADDMARALGGRAHLTALRRIRNGFLHVDHASLVGAAVAMIGEGQIDDMLIAPAEALASLPEVRVDEATEFRVRNGRSLEVRTPEGGAETNVRITGRTGDLLAVYRRASPDVLEPEVVIA